MTTSPFSDLGLNEGQLAGAHKLLHFLVDPNQKEIILSGGGGTGKTKLISVTAEHIVPAAKIRAETLGAKFKDIDDIPLITATTNTAASVLHAQLNLPGKTIHNALGLVVTPDFSTGQDRIKPKGQFQQHYNKLVFIDESPMIDSTLLKYIRAGYVDSKIIYVGDKYQLAPVKERVPPVYQLGLPEVELTEQMRNAGQPALMALCAQLVEQVQTGSFKPIQIVPGVIDHLPDNASLGKFLDTYVVPGKMDIRILAYTNNRVEAFNAYIREKRGLDVNSFKVGEEVVLASHTKAKGFNTEDHVKIIKKYTNKSFPVNDLSPVGYTDYVISPLGYKSYLEDSIKVPDNPGYLKDLIKYLASEKRFAEMYRLRDTFTMLRNKEASTVHKIQGQTCDYVLIDLSDISTCRDPQQAARMLYVACGRARKGIIFSGDLAAKFGGLIT